MKITESKLRQIIRKSLMETGVPVYAGSKETPGPLEVEEWANSKGMGFDCWNDPGWPYPTICEVELPQDDGSIGLMRVKAHRNRNAFIRVTVMRYRGKQTPPGPTEYIHKDKNVESFGELETLLGDFEQMFRRK